MIFLGSKLNMRELLEETKKLPYKKDGTGALMAFGPYQVPPVGPVLLDAAIEIARLRNAKFIGIMVNILPPGLELPKHVDPLPQHYPHGGKVERWHLCIEGKCGLWEEGGPVWDVFPGFWLGPLKYWVKHQAWNHGSVERVHLVVDLDKAVDLG